jgi:hypothetical protein
MMKFFGGAEKVETGGRCSGEREENKLVERTPE